MAQKVFIHLESNRGYSRDLLRGIYDYNNQISHWDIIFEPAYFLKNNRTNNRINLIQSVKPDACILENSEDIAQMAQLGIPMIQVTSVNHVEGIPYVKGNYLSDAKLAIQYFIRKGFRSLAFLGIENLEWSLQRMSFFQEMAISSNTQFSSFLLKGNEEDVLSYNFENLVTWIKSLPKPTGVLCCNDDFGQILINACSMAQVKVPHEIAVLGIDNDELICNITYPNLSSIARNHQSTAFNICSTLSDMLQGKVPNQQIILTEALEVIERTSTDTVAITDKEVNKSIQFISANIHKNLEVQDIVQASNSSLKVLNQKFQKAIGHSIFQEIQVRKLSRFKQLLSTNRSIKEIAFELGFNDHSHISRWFSKLEGITPNEWRKKMGG